MQHGGAWTFQYASASGGEAGPGGGRRRVFDISKALEVQYPKLPCSSYICFQDVPESDIKERTPDQHTLGILQAQAWRLHEQTVRHVFHTDWVEYGCRDHEPEKGWHLYVRPHLATRMGAWIGEAGGPRCIVHVGSNHEVKSWYPHDGRVDTGEIDSKLQRVINNDWYDCPNARKHWNRASEESVDSQLQLKTYMVQPDFDVMPLAEQKHMQAVLQDSMLTVESFKAWLEAEIARIRAKRDKATESLLQGDASYPVGPWMHHASNHDIRRFAYKTATDMHVFVQGNRDTYSRVIHVHADEGLAAVYRYNPGTAPCDAGRRPKKERTACRYK